MILTKIHLLLVHIYWSTVVGYHKQLFMYFEHKYHFHLPLYYVW